MCLPKLTVPEWLAPLPKIWFIQELWITLRLFGPIALGYIIGTLMGIISLVFCGHYPKDTALVLEGAGLAFSIINLTSNLVMFGLGSAVDTLASQAYGAGSYKKVGVYLQRGILIHALALLVVLALWLNIESILNLLHQPPCVIEFTITFIHGYAFALPAVLFYYLLQKCLQAQGIVYPFVLSEGIGILVSVVAHYLLMFVADLGILGAAIAFGLAQYSSFASLLAIIWVRKLHIKTWGGWSWECLNDWGQYIQYSILGLFITVAELGTYEVGILVVGLTGSLQQGILVVLFNYYYLIFMVTYALRTTTAVRVGNELGAGNAKKAKRAMFVCLSGAFTWVIPVEVLTLSLKDYIPMIFTSDDTILQAINVHFYIMAVTIFGDAVHNCLSGAVVGSGWQHVGAVMNVSCFWIVGIPLAVSMALAVRLGALGYLMGLATATILLACSYTVVVSVMNWKKRSEIALKMAAFHLGEKNCQTSDSSSSKDVNNHEQTVSKISAGIPNSHNKWNCENETDLDQNNTMKTKSTCAKNTSLIPTTESCSEGSNLESRPNGEHKNKSAVGWKTVVVRILTAAPFIILCVGAVVISQELVYHQAMACNTTIPGNMSGYLPPGQLHAKVLHTMSSNNPLPTKPSDVVSAINHLPLPTPTPQQG